MRTSDLVAVLLVAVVAVVVVVESAAAASLSDDCAYLKTFYTAMQGSEWHRADGWNTPGTSCCDWFGVSCDTVDDDGASEERVVGLTLENNILIGALPANLTLLSALRNLSLANVLVSNNNFIYGSLPPSWSSFTRLASLSLSGTTITGTLPPSWRVWRTLQQLTGSLPQSWSAWTQLTDFDMTEVSVTSSFPAAWSAWRQLRAFSMPYCSGISGSLPSEWAAWSEMRTFDVRGTPVSGTLPSEWSSWTSVESFALSSQQLGGTLPSEWSSWTAVSALEIFDCNLSESLLPPEWSALSSLSLLNLRNNGISGSMPSSWAAWPAVSIVNLESNYLLGDLPSEWSAWAASLTELELGVNALNSTLPPEWGALRQLQALTLAEAGVRGTLPSEWREMTALTTLFLNTNALTGSLPSEWAEMASLQVLYVSENALTGSLPSEWAALNVGILRTGNNRFTGSLPTEWSNMRRLTVLTVEYNLLSGTIAVCAPSLRSLYVHSNQFSGLDACLADTEIVSLNLQYNRFETVPADVLEGFGSRLDLLDLRNCNLSLDIGALPFAQAAIPAIRLGGNVGVIGTFESLVYQFNNSTVPSYIEMDLSNTTVSGQLSNLDPQAWLRTYLTEWPLANLISLNVADNADITGLLPYNWFSFVAANRQSLELNVANCTGLAAATQPLPHDCTELNNAVAPLLFDCRALPVSYGSTAYECRPLVYPDGVRVIGLDAAYFQYRTCRCTPGYIGTPPHCVAHSSDARVLGLSIAFGLSGLTLLVLVVRKFRRWRSLLRDVARARALLREYQQVQLQPMAAGGAGTLLSERLLASHGVHIDDEWIVRYGDLHIVQQVASGAQGRVSMAVWNRTTVAVKEFFVFGDEDRDDLLGEAVLHVKLRHPNIVQLLAVCLDPPCTVTEWMDRGSLFHCLAAPTFDLPGPQIRRIALDVARGMLYLHSKGIVHRDLKSLNVMLDARGTAKVGDFGLARRTSLNQSLMTVGKGTSHWMAPEVFSGGRYSEQCDVYSYGIILWELCTRQPPFEDVQFAHDIAALVCSGQRPEIPPDCPPLLADLMQRCWQMRPEQRPTFDTIVQELEAAGGDDLGPVPVE